MANRVFKWADLDAYVKAAYCDEQKTMRQIAEEIGCSPVTVLNRLKTLGVETRRRGYVNTPESVVEHCRALGRSKRGQTIPEEVRKKISESKKTHKMGAKKIRKDGYISIYYPDYPSSTKEGRVLEHVYVMEQAIGRRLRKDESIHHVNKIRTDNRIENLMLMTKSEHARLHALERAEMKRRNNHD